MQIPQGERKTVFNAPRAGTAPVSAPEPGAYAAKESRALMIVSDGINRAGVVMNALDAQQKKLNLAAFEAQAQQEYKAYALDLERDNDYEGYEKKYETFEKGLEERGRQALGAQEYADWRASAGEQFFGGVQLGTRELAVQKKGDKMRVSLSETLNHFATLAGNAQTPLEMESYRAKASEVLEQAFLPKDGTPAYIDEAQRKTLSDEFERRAGSAYLDKQIQANPEIAAADLADPEKYKVFTPQERQQWEKQALKGVLQNVKNDVWNALSSARTNTGEVSLDAAQKLLRAAGYDEATQAEILNDVSARMADEKRVRDQQARARDEAFYTAADNLVKSGGLLTDGLKLAETYANDGKDKFTKAKFIQELFKEHGSSAAKSDPDEYLRLWKGVQDGTVSEGAVKQSFNNGLLNASDYRGLVKELYGENGEKTARSLAIKQIEKMMAPKIADKDDRAVFLLEVKRQSEGKTPEEMISVADELLKKSGFWGLGAAKYEQDATRNLEQQRVLGDFARKYPDGKKYAAVIVRGIRQQHPDNAAYPWGAEDVDEFIKTYGGEEKLFTAGTPENQALKRMAELNLPATAARMNDAIDFYYAASGKPSLSRLRKKVAEQELQEKDARRLAARKEMIERLRKLESGEARLEEMTDKHYGY